MEQILNDGKVAFAASAGILQNFLIHGQPFLNFLIGLLTVIYLLKRILKKNNEDV